MSLSIADQIQTPYEQLPQELKDKIIAMYIDEEKVDLIEMYLHNMNTSDLIATAEAAERMSNLDKKLQEE